VVGGGSMGRNVRWAVAGLVTAAAFAVPVWLCGAVVLPPLLEDEAVRWSLASALGAVLGSLAVLWGHGFATRVPAAEQSVSSVSSVQATAGGAVAVGGNNQGSIFTGRAPAPAQPPVAAPAALPHPVPPSTGSVTASGPGSIAIGGDNAGPLSTGDRPDSRHP
jgi:hypothetical protein